MKQPQLEPHGDKYILTEDYRVRVKGYSVKVPCGFITDGASIPRFLWSAFGSPFDPKHMAGAVVHDYLYMSGILKRGIADTIFRILLQRSKVTSKKAWTFYYAVRLFGWKYYHAKS